MIMNNSFEKSLEVLRSGGLILYPTDTVWGIGCDACNEQAVRKIFALKKRSDSKSLVLLADSLERISLYVKEIPEMARQLVEVNDAPMTIVYPDAWAETVSDRGLPALAPSCVADDGSVGIRIPYGSAFCMRLTAAFGKPVVSTSANISGELAPRSFDDISAAIREGVDYVVDRSCEGNSTGCSSQIIKVDMDGGVRILRG